MRWFNCKHCGISKPETEFYVDRSKPSGRKPRCKPCDLLSRDKKKRAEYEKQYWAKRRKERREMVLKSHNKNKEHHKQQRKKYLCTPLGREMYRRQTQNRYARAKNAFVEHINPIDVYNEQNGICYICGQDFAFHEMHIDHVQPLARGGKHERSNVKMACKKCNLSKGAKPLEELTYQVV